MVPQEIRAMPAKGLCKWSRIQRIEFVEQNYAELKPREGTVYVPASLERIGGLKFTGCAGERFEERLERLAFSLLVRVPERGKVVVPKFAGAAEADTRAGVVRE